MIKVAHLNKPKLLYVPIIENSDYSLLRLHNLYSVVTMVEQIQTVHQSQELHHSCRRCMCGMGSEKKRNFDESFASKSIFGLKS